MHTKHIRLTGRSRFRLFSGTVTAVTALALWPGPVAGAIDESQSPQQNQPSGDVEIQAAADGWAAANAWGQNGTTGGAGGQTLEVDTSAEFLSAIANTNPLIIKVSGMITLPGPMHDVKSNKTIVGVGANSGITRGGLNIGLPINNATTSPPANAVKNIIIRNMNFTNWADDAINVQMFSHHIWIDHNRWTTGFDGGVDIKRGSSYVTVSWNHSAGTAKNMLLGHADNNAAQDSGRLKTTYHHNFFDRSNSRSPRVRYGDPVHVYNNYYLSPGDYGVRSAEHAGVIVEGNYFENTQDPYHVESGATGPGRIVARNNCFVNSDQGQASGSVGNPPYSYTLDPACNVKAIVTAGAGAGKVGLPSVSSSPAVSEGTFAESAPIGWASVAGGTTGGAGGTVVDVDTTSEFLAVVRASGRHVIRVSGMIPISGMVNVGSTKTIIGVGSGSGFTGGGLNLKTVSNVIIRNLNFRNASDDAINVTDSAHHVWIDHNDLSTAYDGLVDIKRGSDYITVSWNHTRNHFKDMLLGHDDNNGAQDRGHLRVTFHHNWFDSTNERHPRVRFGNPVHVFNNYTLKADYGVASNMEAGVLVENNFFENVVRPLAIGVYEGPKGTLVQRGNVFVNSGPPEAAGSVKPIPYSYTLDAGTSVRSIVTAGAGTGKI